MLCVCVRRAALDPQVCEMELIKIPAHCPALFALEQEEAAPHPEFNRCCSAHQAGNKMGFADWYQLFH